MFLKVILSRLIKSALENKYNFFHSLLIIVAFLMQIWLHVSGAENQMRQNPGLYEKILRGPHELDLKDTIKAGQFKVHVLNYNNKFNLSYMSYRLYIYRYVYVF